MSQIEPDLVSSAIAGLKEKYADENSDQKEARRLRYLEAIKKYKERLSEYVNDAEKQIKEYKTDLFDFLCNTNDAVKDDVLLEIESSIGAS